MTDARGFIVAGLFALTTMIFVMIALNPHIAEVQLFGVLATAVISGGLGGALGFYFGSSKSDAPPPVPSVPPASNPQSESPQ